MTNDAPAKDAATFAADAFAHFRHAGATGEWDGYLALVSDDYTFRYPVPGPFAGMNHGKDRFVAYCQHVSVERGIKVDISEPTQTSFAQAGADGIATAVFESDVDGVVEGNPIRTCMAVSMDVRNGRVVGHREFIGDIRPFMPPSSA